jgi:hypothetical protein
MTSRARLWAIVAVSYISARVLVRLVTVGAARIDLPFAVELIVVPVAQIAALELVAAVAWRHALRDEDSCES